MPNQNTIDTGKNYVGKIIRTNYIYNGEEYSGVGIVYQQERVGEHLRFTLLLPSGQEWRQPFTTESMTKISSVRMEESLRTALKDLCQAKLEHKAFLDRFWSEKRAQEQRVERAQKVVQEASGQLSHNEFRNAIEELFRSRYPSQSGYDSRCYFELDSLSSNEVTIRHMQEVEKYATPERYPFLYRRYDDTMAVSESHPSYQSFCQRYGAPVLPTLKGYCAGEPDACVGDKNILILVRRYTFQLPHGLSRQSLKDISAILDGTISQNKKKPSLDAQITGANSRKPAANSGKPTQGKEPQTR